MNNMKNFIFLFFSLLTLQAVSQVPVEWEKSNFPGKEKEFKEAKRNYDKGKDFFEEGKKIHDEQIQWVCDE